MGNGVDSLVFYNEYNSTLETFSLKYIVDIDGTICYTVNSNYEESRPYKDRILRLNGLFDEGHEVHYYTARGSQSGKDWQEFTKAQLDDWGVKYTSVRVGKEHYDKWIDDKAINDKEFFKD